MVRNISVVYAVFSERTSFELAVVTLGQRGFRPEDVSVQMPENLGNRVLLTEKTSKSPEGAAAGGATGGVVGGALGWFVGIGALAIPGLGPFIAVGPFIATLAGIVAGAALGGLTGGLIGKGMTECEAKWYEGRVRSGGRLLSVHCDDDDWAQRAVQILRDSGGEDITKAGQASVDYDTTGIPVGSKYSNSL
jgi:uncharacterized protein YcfJ